MGVYFIHAFRINDSLDSLYSYSGSGYIYPGTLRALANCASVLLMAGALYAANFSSVVPSKFSIDTSILILVFVVLGGLGNILGSVISATVLTLLPELLREFDDYRMLVYAVVLILTMLITNSPIVKSLIGAVKEGVQKLFTRKHSEAQENS